ncbi:MAG: DUF4864 domain-containing protein [Proteobacteria bacterium]|nr:DUF4864 domain-containing protein [Pseudomonadota bacterium]
MKLCIHFVFLFFIFINLHANQKNKEDFDITKKIIFQQLEAFKINDAPKAYSFAAPFIKIRFEDPESFMSMVKDNYEPISNAKDFYFLKSKIYNADIYHQLQIISQSNQSYLATYSLVFIEDEWKISGCVLSLMTQQSI